MTQDPYEQPPGTGSVVRGEVVPDDEANVTPPTVPVTQFQKVAPALRGDHTDPTDAPSEQETQQSPDPDWTWSGGNQSAARTMPGATDGVEPGEDRSEDVGAVRSPDAGDEDADASPDGPAAEAGAETSRQDAQDPAVTQPDLYGNAAGAQTEAAAAGAVGKDADASAQEGLRPGESDHGLGDFNDLTYGSLLPDAAEFKAQWQQVQFRFVDDPRSSVTEAADVVAQVTAKLEAAMAERQRALRSRWSEGKSTDTESLRETLLMYRAFLDQLTGPKDG